MHVRSFTIVGVVTVFLALAAGVAVYDHGRRDTIADGVSVGGVPIGGLTRAQATTRLRAAIIDPLRRSIVVDHGSRRWQLTAREARVTTNLDATIDEALARSRTGNALTRTFRALAGGTVHARLQPVVGFSDGAIVRLVDRVRVAVDRQPQDATIAFSATRPRTTPSRDGLALDATALHRAIRATFASPTAARRVPARTHHVAPTVSSQDLERQYGTALIVNRKAFKLEVFKQLKLVKTYRIAVGRVGLETPAGLYHIQNKAINPAWTEPHSSWVPKKDRGKVVPGGDPKNPLKARWLGIFDGAGIHGIAPNEYGSIGHAASHGCVRMRIADVIDLYPRVPVGAPIYIA